MTVNSTEEPVSQPHVFVPPKKIPSTPLKLSTSGPPSVSPSLGSAAGTPTSFADTSASSVTSATPLTPKPSSGPPQVPSPVLPQAPLGVITQVTATNADIRMNLEAAKRKARLEAIRAAEKVQASESTDVLASASDTPSPSHQRHWKRLQRAFMSLLPCCYPSYLRDKHGKFTESTEMMVNKTAVKSKKSRMKVVSSTVSLMIHEKLTEKKEDSTFILPSLAPEDIGRKCLVLDLDETLVHSSFMPVKNADFTVQVQIDKAVHIVYVLKRPGVDAFLERLGKQFEVVIFTASLSKYADPVLDALDIHGVVKHRLFRESCVRHKEGSYVKDLSLLGRDLKDVIIIDNSPSCYMFHPTNAIPITSWFSDPSDTELHDLIPFLEDLKLVNNVTLVLDNAAD